MRALGLIIVMLLFSFNVQAEENDQSTLYIVAGENYLRFESISTLFENVAARLSEENVAVAYSSDYYFDTPHPSIIVIESDLGGEMVGVASGDKPLRALSPILESHYAYGFSIAHLDSAEAVDALVGFGLYVMGRCDQAMPYLGDHQRYADSRFDLGAVMAFYAGNCSLLQDDLNSAVSHFLYTLELARHGSYSASSNLTWTYLQLGENKKAFEHFDGLFPAALNRTDRSYLVTLLVRRLEFYGLAIRLYLRRYFY